MAGFIAWGWLLWGAATVAGPAYAVAVTACGDPPSREAVREAVGGWALAGWTLSWVTAAAVLGAAVSP